MNISLWIALWISFFGCATYIVDAVVLWHHRPALVIVAFPLAVVRLLPSRSWRSQGVGWGCSRGYWRLLRLESPWHR